MSAHELFASQDCVTVGCPNEADGPDQLCRYCRNYLGRKKPKARLQLVHSREETPVSTTRTCEEPGCNEPTCSDRGRYARVCQTHKHLVTERLRAAGKKLGNEHKQTDGTVPATQKLGNEGKPPLAVVPPDGFAHIPAPPLDELVTDEDSIPGADQGWLTEHAELLELHVEKSATYGTDGDRLHNFTAVGHATGKPPERYAIERVLEKCIRALNMIDEGRADEVREYRDIASLGLIASALLRRRA